MVVRLERLESLGEPAGQPAAGPDIRRLVGGQAAGRGGSGGQHPKDVLPEAEHSRVAADSQPVGHDGQVDEVSLGPGRRSPCCGCRGDKRVVDHGGGIGDKCVEVPRVPPAHHLHQQPATLLHRIVLCLLPLRLLQRPESDNELRDRPLRAPQAACVRSHMS